MTLARRTPLKSSGRIKPKKRSASDFARIYGSKKRVAWVKSLPCWYCGRTGESQNAHTENGGIGYKAGYQTILPLCALCHSRFDQRVGQFGNRVFREMMQSAAWQLDEQWQAFQRSDAGGER